VQDASLTLRRLAARSLLRTCCLSSEVARDGYEALIAGKDHVVAGSFKK
jgi:hypothetical protein